MAESDLRRAVISALTHLDAVSVENSAYPGTPDVNYVEGWLELKWDREWPKREETVFRIEHFTPQQRVFLRRRWHRGGNAYLLLQVGREYLLFDGATAQQWVGLVDRATLEKIALKVWHGGMDWLEFPKWLTREI